ncbi:23S rRNA pseudouridine(2605) synthase RluB [Mangrovitalea sediminis]|uniref:23S rRNA pseudouridine(2605) synthase RluB n=1 Tax=Mangrovitalea sediminis TaxID=1982043 RepID=UPI000BE57993|nr:23S rRNA pseudouridine(2605) synthase RluB [Mangrovitalea sediminis]
MSHRSGPRTSRPNAPRGAQAASDSRPRRLPEESRPVAPVEPERLQKVLARVGVGSRRDIEGWITEGRVTVNGEPATLGQKVTDQDRVVVDGKVVEIGIAIAPERRVIVYNKPEGEVTTRRDPEGRPTVFDRLPRLKGQRWVSIGRLDINTMGLLMFTTDGELANRLMHPSQQIDREYAVRIFGEVDDDMLQRLREGVLLEDGMASFSDISEAGGSGMNRWFHVTLLEGRNREVRRLWESQGVKVSRLKRVRYGPILLASRITLGRWEELDQKSVDILSRAAGLEPAPIPKKPPGKGKARSSNASSRPSRKPPSRPAGRRRRPE